MARAEDLRQPWPDRLGCVVRDVMPICVSTDSWWIRDDSGMARR